MSGRSRALGCVLAGISLSLAASLVAPARAEVPARPAGPPNFVPRATWQETVLASREALLQMETEGVKQETATTAANPVLNQFRPLRGEAIGGEAPKQIRLRVAGLENLYIGCGKPNYLVFGDPRFTDRQGNVLPVPTIRMESNNGHARHDAQGNWEPMKVGKLTFATGIEMYDAEISYRLRGQAEWLELSLVSRGKGSPTPYWFDHRSHSQRKLAKNTARDHIWRLTAERFPERKWALQRNLEEVCDIWKLDWTPGDLQELARRYATACSPETRKSAETLAQNVRNFADLRRLQDLFYFQHARQRVELGRRTLEFVQRKAERPQFAAALASLETEVAHAEKSNGTGGTSLYEKAAELRRKIILSHPLLDFDRLLINKRSAHLPEHMCDQYLGRHSRVAPGLAVLDSWKDHPRETLLLEGKLPQGGTIHPDLSSDGKRVLFAFADHSSTRTGTLRGYFIYELSLETGKVRQVTGTATDPMIGLFGRETTLIEDMNPCYLPDGGIAFISTRSQQFGRCHGSRYVPSYTLFRSELDGTNIRPLSFNESNEWGPSVLHDGLIIYTRWDYVNRHDVIFQSLWVTRPDGTATAHYYGNNSRSPCLIGEARAIPGSHKVVATAAAHHGQTLGTLILVDPHKGQDHGTPLTWITPELSFPESGIPEGITLTPRPLPGDAGRSPGTEGRRGMRAATPYALSEDLFLAAYQDGAEYAVYLIDTLGGRELIYADPTISCFNPIPLRPTPPPPVLPSAIAGKEQERTGRFFIHDVYQCSHPLEPGSIKSLRVNAIISQPTSSVPQRSWASNEIVKRILGTVPVDGQGSTAFEAPADTPLQLQLLDANGMAVMTMRSLVYLQPGEEAGCVGCHEPRNQVPVAASRLKPLKIHRLQPPAGPRYDGGFSFVRTVQPVLDRYCIGCHGLEKTEGGLDLLGSMETTQEQKRNKRATRTLEFSVSYFSLASRGNLVKIAPRNGETYPSRPKDYFAHAGRLAQFLLDGHPERKGNKLVQLDRDSFRRIVDWLDVNGQFYGDYSFNRLENQPPLSAGEKALREAIEKRFGQELARQPFAALVNVAIPAESRILKAPLAVKAGGWGQIERGAWPTTADPSYREMARLVETSITPLTYHDIAGTCGRDTGCRCGVCWVRRDIESRTKSRTTGTQIGSVAEKK